MLCEDCYYYEDQIVLSKTGLPKSLTKACGHWNNVQGRFPVVYTGSTQRCPHHVHREIEALYEVCIGSHVWGDPDEENREWMKEFLK